MDISTIGINFDTSGLLKGTAALKENERQAGRTADAADRTGASAKRASDSFSSWAGVIKGLALGATITQFIRTADALNGISSRLSLVTKSTAELSQVQRQLLQLSQQNRADFGATADLYTALARSTKDLGVTQEQLLKITGTFGKALIVSGGSAQSAQAAITQFNQAMASGVLRGEEFNSISEQAPRIMDLLAVSLGKTRGELRQMAQDGKLTSGVVLPAILKGASEVEREFAKMPVTVAQAGQVFQNSLGQAVLAIDGATGATSSLAGAVLDLSTIMDALSASASGSNKEVGQTSLIQRGLATVFETVAVLGANVMFVLRGIGTEFGAIGAQIGAVLRGDFAQAAEIGRLAKADAEAARAQIDATTRNILNARQRAQDIKDVAGITDAQSRRMAALNDTIKVNTKATGDNSKAIKAANKELAEQAKLLAELNGLSPDYLQDLTRLETIRRKGNVTEAQYIALVEQLIAKQPSSIALAKAQADAIKQVSDAEADGLRQYQDYLDSLTKGVQTQRDRVTALEAEAEAERLAESLNISLAQAVEMVNIAKLKEKQIGATDPAVIKALQDEITARERILELTASGEVRKANKDAATAAGAEWKRFYEDLERGLTDSLFRAFEAGKGFFSTLWDGIKNLFKTTVLKLAIQAVVGGVTGLGTSAATAALGFNEAGGANLGSIASTANTLRSAYNLVTSGFAGFGEQIGNIANRAYAYFNGGANLSGSTVAGIAEVGASLSGAIVGAIVGNIISGGYSAIGKNPNTAVAVGTVVGGIVGSIVPVLGTALGAALGGALGGVFNRVFGRKLTEVGIQGTFGESGFSGNAYSYEKGGFFRSNRERNLGPVDNETTNLLNQAFSEVKNTVAGLAQQLGVGRDAIDGFTTSIRLNFKGLNDQQINDLLGKTFTDIGNTLADFVLDQTAGLKELAIRGETSIETLTRLADFLSTINGVVDFLNIGMFDLSVAGVRAAESFVQLFGGLENFAAVTSVYAENFFSEAEKRAIKIERLADTFRQLDAAGAFRDTAEEYQRLLVDPTRESFRALVEAQDVNTEAGRSTTAALLALAGAVAEVAPAADAAAASVTTLARAGISLTDVFRQAESVAESLLNEVELRAFRIARIQQELAAGGINVSAEQIGMATVAQLREMIGNALSVGTPEALAAVSVLLNVADAFIALQPAGQQAIDSVDGLTASLETMAERARLEIQLLRAAGNEAEALARERAAELGALAPSNQALQQHIYAIEDAQAAVQAATAAYQEAQQAAQAQVQALEQQQSAAQSALQALEQDASRWLSLRDRAQSLSSGISQSLGGADNREASLLAQLNSGSLEDRLQAAEQLKSLYEQTASVQDAAAQQALSNAQQMVNLGRQLRDYVQSLRVGDLSALTPAQKLAEAQAQYQATLTAAQGGDALAQGRLQGVADTFLRLAREFDPGSYSTDVFPTVTGQLDGFSGMLLTEGETQTAIQQAILDTANAQTGLSAEQIAKLTALQGTVQGLLAEAQSGYAGVASQQAIAQAQLSAISSQLEAARSQSGALDSGILAAQNNLLAVQQQANAYLAQIAQNATAGGASGFDPARAQIIRDYAASLPQDESGVRMAIEAAQANGVSSAELDAALGYAPGTSNQAALDRGYPAFAGGGDFAGGIRMVGERGPELELTGPSRIFSAQQTRQIVGGGSPEMLAELRALRQEVRGLRETVASGAQATVAATQQAGQMTARSVESGLSKGARAVAVERRRETA